ncbi:MAG: 4-hydroxythreonine-4-phosphate dehydrogenase [Bacteroidota bacterium]|jgi:4-hydroxythreonine-4-phosphate dehydrogenase
MEKIRVGITTGDLNGIGLEVALKVLSNPKIAELCTPVIYASPKVVAYHKNVTQVEFQFSTVQTADEIEDEDRIYVVNCWADTVNITLGKVSEEGGSYAFRSLEKATEELKAGFIDAIVTPPIHKKAMQMAGFPFVGHTEYITEKFESKESLMFMVCDDFRIGLVTNHLPLAQVAAAVTKEKIAEKLKIMNKSLKIDFFIEKPLIAVLGLNPHAGDEGAIGTEEETIIRPAVEEAKAAGIMAMGPFAADGFFGSGQHRRFDGVLAMYHDQGLVAFKALSFGEGVNFTAGLPVVRTSPDHGTGFDIAGLNKANPDSFRRALYLAIDVARNRDEHAEMSANPLVSHRSRKKMKAQADDYAE